MRRVRPPFERRLCRRPVVSDLLTPLWDAPSVEAGVALALRRLVDVTDAQAGALAFAGPGAEPLVVTAARQAVPPALEGWLRGRVGRRVAGLSVSRAVAPGGTRALVLTAPLGPSTRPVGAVALMGARLRRAALPSGFSRELGAAIERAWQLHRRTLRLQVLNEIMRLSASAEPLDTVLGVFAAGAASLLDWDSLAVSLVEAERGEFAVLDLPARTLGLGARHDARLPLAGTLLARVLQEARALRVDDLAGPDVPPRSRELIAARGYRSALLVPLIARGGVVGAITAVARRPHAFGDVDEEILSELSPPLASAIEQRRLLGESQRLASETRALLEAGRAVSASLDVQETIRVILDEARSVLGVASCSLTTLDAATGELVSVASLDLPPEMVTQIRLRVGEGITGLAVLEQQPVQSADLSTDPRVRYPELSRTAGLRSMLAVPLRVGPRAIGAITVLRRDVHQFSPGEEKLLVALADQAAIALEHARLYAQLEGMVAERTRELDTQKRFVEVVLETLPLGVFVLDGDLTVVRANREGERGLGGGDLRGRALPALIPQARAEAVAAFARSALAARQVRSTEEELVVDGGAKIFRLTAAPIEPHANHLVLLIEDVTLAKRLERQMLLTERLTTAGRLAAGVAHELNNPLATIAGCAEALLARTGEGALAGRSEMADFRHYLGLIEEEAYRCKDITGSLLQFVREPGSLRGPTDLNALVVKTVDLLAHQSRFRERRFATELEPALPTVTVNEGQLRQVFLGIAANALDAMGADGTLHIRSRRRGDEIEVEFEDEGPGIPDDILGRIFDPFFTTKPPGHGTGLGLAIAQGVMTDHGGRIEVTSRAGKGSTFRVVLPA